MNVSVIKITPEESLFVERLFYEHESDKALVSVLVHEICDKPNSESKEMLDHYISECKKSFERLSLAQNTIIGKYLNKSNYGDIKFIFDFQNEEVRVSID